MKLSKLCLWAIVGTVVLTISAFLLAYILPFYQIEIEFFIAIGMIILLYLCVVLGCAVALEKGRAPRFMRRGIAVGTIALVGWIAVFILEQYNIPLDIYVFVHWPTSWACLIMVIGLLLLPEPRPKWWMQLRRITIALFILLTVAICIIVTIRIVYIALDYNSSTREIVGDYEEVVAKFSYVIGLLACGGAIFVWLAAAFIKPTQNEASNIERTSYWLCCPRCGLEQQAMTGSDTCDQCNLQIKVELA